MRTKTREMFPVGMGECPPPTRVFVQTRNGLYLANNAPLSGMQADEIADEEMSNAIGNASQFNPEIQSAQKRLEFISSAFLEHAGKDSWVERLLASNPSLAEDATKLNLVVQDFKKEVMGVRERSMSAFRERDLDYGMPACTEGNIITAGKVIRDTLKPLNSVINAQLVPKGHEKHALPFPPAPSSLSNLNEFVGDRVKLRDVFKKTADETIEWLQDLVDASGTLITVDATSYAMELNQLLQSLLKYRQLFDVHGDDPRIIQSFYDVVEKVERIQLALSFRTLTYENIINPVASHLTPRLLMHLSEQDKTGRDNAILASDLFSEDPQMNMQKTIEAQYLEERRILFTKALEGKK